MPTKSEAIKRFLTDFTKSDLAALYDYGMEVQVNVAQDGGQPIQGKAGFTGRLWRGYSDGEQTWKSFRIPWNAATEPEYSETDIKGKSKHLSFDLSVHAEGIGMTGWCWEQGVSKWVAFDFDSITGHSENHTAKLTAEELQEVQEAACSIPWVTVRKSTAGQGLHLYVFLDNVPTATHTEHAALGRSILGKMSAAVGFDFTSKVDACGGNMWVWHRKLKDTDGLALIKQGSVLIDIPINWKDHLTVIKGKRRKNLPSYIEDLEQDAFDQLTGQRAKVKLDKEHQKLLKFLEDSKAGYWWDADHHLAVCHTTDLAKAHEVLNFRGLFQTISTGKDQGDHNCLSGETEILTSEGPRLIKDVAKDGFASLYVYTPQGFKWIKCEIKSFGIQETIPIDFGNQTSVRATLGHEWLTTYDGKINFTRKKKTYELQSRNNGGTRDSYLPLAEIELPEIDDRGYAHGFVYGDGWEVNTRGKISTSVTLFKQDQDLVKLLSRYGNIGSEKVIGHGYLPTARQLSDNWKWLPENPTREYALGFILGLISADGFIHKTGTICIYQSDLLALEEIRKLALFAGLRVRNVRLYTESGGYDKKGGRQPGWALTISSYNLTADHFLRKDHKANFKAIKTKTVSIRHIDFDNKIKEEVFCAVVPSYHNFTLANGIVTGNCFLTPKEQPAGAWTVRRFTPGVAEAPTWTQDASGWTICVYNQDPTLSTAARAHDGIEDEKGGFYFNEAEVASTALQSLGTHVDIPTWAYNRDTVIKQHRDGRRLIVKIKREPTDRYDDLRGWREDKGWWTRIFDAKLSQPDTTEPQNFDNLIRHLITVGGDDYGWVIRSSNKWHTEPLGHVKIALKSLELSEKEVNKALGNCIMEGWTIVNEPFQPEFPGDRKWNRDAAQMRYPPQQKEPFIHLTWDKILDHCGLGLDSAIKEDGWCQANGIDNGGDYLRVWVASLFQEPTKPLPYLFFYSKEEQTGKSTFHDALRLLITPKGYTKANAALINPQAFNEEMENAVLCAIEECDLRKGGQARNRIKDWVTSPTLLIHPKGRTPYLVTNTSHFVQTANDPGECPIIPGDTRITVGYVPPLDPLEMVPRDVLFQLLSKEAPAFMATLLKLEIPKCTDRLNIPVINTEEKALSASLNRSDLEIFIDELTFDDPGGSVSYKEVWNRFQEWLDPNTVHLWSKIRMGRELPAKYPKGRLMSEGAQFYVGNLSFTKPSTAKRLRLILRKDSLIPRNS